MALEIVYNGPANTYNRRGRQFVKGVVRECRDQDEHEYLMGTGYFSAPGQEAPAKKGGVKIVRHSPQSEAARKQLEQNVGMFQTKKDAIAWAANHGLTLDVNVSLKRLNGATVEIKKRLDAGNTVEGVEIDGLLHPKAEPGAKPETKSEPKTGGKTKPETVTGEGGGGAKPGETQVQV
jgi:hypothetical protein